MIENEMPYMIKINETQYDWLVNGNLNESLHYPQFLEEFVNDVYMLILNDIKTMIKNNIDDSDFFYKNLNFEYVDEIHCIITITHNEDISSHVFYGAKYIPTNIKDKHIHEATLYIQIPLNKNKKTGTLFLKSIVFHELMHLYDDYQRLLNNSNVLSYNSTVNHTMSAFENFIKSGHNRLGVDISKIAYLNLGTEQKAFSSQVVYELYNLDCTPSNFREKMKQTLAYKNYIKIKNELYNTIQNATFNELWFFNLEIFDNYIKSNIPKFDYNKKDVDIEQYRNNLLKWADNTCHQFMLKFGGVVTYYLENFKQESLKRNNMDLSIY